MPTAAYVVAPVLSEITIPEGNPLGVTVTTVSTPIAIVYAEWGPDGAHHALRIAQQTAARTHAPIAVIDSNGKMDIVRPPSTNIQPSALTR